MSNEDFESRDISQSTDITDLAEVLRELNPDVEIKLGDVDTDPNARERIYSSKPVEELNLPEGFEYNEKNGITNKHNTETGAYMSARVEGLEPTQSKDISQSTDITRNPERDSLDNWQYVAMHKIAGEIAKHLEETGGDMAIKNKALQLEIFTEALMPTEREKDILIDEIPRDVTDSKKFVLFIHKIEENSNEEKDKGISGTLIDEPIKIGKEIKLALGKTTKVKEITHQKNNTYLIKTESGSRYLFEPKNRGVRINYDS